METSAAWDLLPRNTFLLVVVPGITGSFSVGVQDSVLLHMAVQT